MARRDGVADAPQRAVTTRKERDIQAAILAYLKLVPGVVVWKSGGGLLPLADGRRVRMGKVGVSDLVGWKTEKVITSWSDGYEYELIARMLVIEVKRPGRYPTVEQQAFLDAVKAAGGISIVA